VFSLDATLLLYSTNGRVASLLHVSVERFSPACLPTRCRSRSSRISSALSVAMSLSSSATGLGLRGTIRSDLSASDRIC
jgi:hypothetical protein